MAQELERMSYQGPAELETEGRKGEGQRAGSQPRRRCRQKLEAMVASAPASRSAICFGGGRGGKGRKVAAKYANPDDPTETWTGRGRKPRWLVGQAERRRQDREVPDQVAGHYRSGRRAGAAPMLSPRTRVSPLSNAVTGFSHCSRLIDFHRDSRGSRNRRLRDSNAPLPSCRPPWRRHGSAPSAARPARPPSPSRAAMVFRALSTSASLASNTSSSCTCSSMRARRRARASCSARGMRIMARRMMSAAEPWIGALMAARSRKPRIDGFLVLISG